MPRRRRKDERDAELEEADKQLQQQKNKTNAQKNVQNLQRSQQEQKRMEKLMELQKHAESSETERLRRQQEEAARKKKEDEEQRHRREAEERKRREEEERLHRELQEKKKKEEEEIRRKEEEQRLMKNAEEKLKEKQKMMEQTQRKKFEEKQRKQVEERKKKEEEEKKKRDIEELFLLEQPKKTQLFLLQQPQLPPDDDFDLLDGNISDEEDRRQFTDDITSNWSESVNYGSIVSGGLRQPRHRDLAARGPIDTVVDMYLDQHHEVLLVPVYKYGRRDGVYMFGTRLMKTRTVDNNIFVGSGGHGVGIRDFTTKFGRVESVKLRGLQSASAAFPFFSMMGALVS